MGSLAEQPEHPSTAAMVAQALVTHLGLLALV